MVFDGQGTGCQLSAIKRFKVQDCNCFKETQKKWMQNGCKYQITIRLLNACIGSQDPELLGHQVVSLTQETAREFQQCKHSKGRRSSEKKEPMLRYNQTIQNMINHPKKVLCHKSNPLPATWTSHLNKNQCAVRVPVRVFTLAWAVSTVSGSSLATGEVLGGEVVSLGRLKSWHNKMICRTDKMTKNAKNTGFSNVSLSDSGHWSLIPSSHFFFIVS